MAGDDLRRPQGPPDPLDPPGRQARLRRGLPCHLRLRSQGRLPALLRRADPHRPGAGALRQGPGPARGRARHPAPGLGHGPGREPRRHQAPGPGAGPQEARPSCVGPEGRAQGRQTPAGRAPGPRPPRARAASGPAPGAHRRHPALEAGLDGPRGHCLPAAPARSGRRAEAPGSPLDAREGRGPRPPCDPRQARRHGRSHLEGGGRHLEHRGRLRTPPHAHPGGRLEPRGLAGREVDLLHPAQRHGPPDPAPGRHPAAPGGAEPAPGPRPPGEGRDPAEARRGQRPAPASPRGAAPLPGPREPRHLLPGRLQPHPLGRERAAGRRRQRHPGSPELAGAGGPG